MLLFSLECYNILRDNVLINVANALKKKKKTCFTIAYEIGALVLMMLIRRCVIWGRQCSFVRLIDGYAAPLPL